MKKGTLFTFIFYIMMSVLIFIFKGNIVRLMLIEDAAIQQAVLFLKIVAPTYLFFGVVLMTLTALEQMNKGYLALILNVIYFAAIIGIGWYLTVRYAQVECLYWTISMMNIVGSIMVFFILRMIQKEFNDAQVSNGSV